MDTADLAKLPIADIADKDCVLFLWATYPKLKDAFQVIEGWGFTYKTCAFTWVKLNPSGVGLHFGLGYWTRQNPELVLLATRGKPKRVNNCVSNVIVSPRGRHSAKPPKVRDEIVRLMGDLPRIELFARETAPGWNSMGNEVDNGMDIRVRLNLMLGY